MIDTNTPDSETHTILGHDIPATVWTEGQRDRWAEIEDEYDLDSVARRAAEVQHKARSLKSARVKAQEKAVKTLEDRLDAEYKKPHGKWNRPKIDKLTEALEEEEGRLITLERQGIHEFASLAEEIANELDAVSAPQEEARLKMAHYLSGTKEPFQKWLERAQQPDYAAASKLVRAGLTPFLERRYRQDRRAGTAKQNESEP